MTAQDIVPGSPTKIPAMSVFMETVGIEPTLCSRRYPTRWRHRNEAA
jgi:hypothetical protein